MATAVVIATVVSSAVVAAVRLDDLRRAGQPGHPFPPAGYYVNPFSNDVNDLVNGDEANRVKADLLHDGDVELQAFAHGDAAVLAQADAGNRLVALRDAIARNDRQGLTERWENELAAVVVGRLADPRDSSVTWAVEERGTSTVEFLAKAGGAVIRVQHPTFDDKFWMAKPRDRYLIVDAEVSANGATGR